MSLRAAASGLAIALTVTVVALAEEDLRRPSSFELAAAGLTDGELAGQRVIVSYAGTRPPKRLIEMIRKGRVAGVIFFASNIESRRRLAAVARRLQQARRRSSLPRALRAPLLLMVDQEGGAVRRLPGAPKKSQAEIGASGRPQAAARKAGRAAAVNLEQAGLNVNLAPVLDVTRRGGGAIADFGRSYGHKPGKVGRLAAAFIGASQRAGVATTAKHFPGLGAARVNTDEAPVRITTALRKLRDTDQAPYGAAIAENVRLVMLANATYTALDRRRPAGLSRRVIESELRDRRGYGGVTITDALEVGGLNAYGSIPKRGLRAARAGADLLLFAGQRIGAAQAAWSRLAKAIRNGKHDRNRAVASAARVLELRGSVR